MSRPRRRQQQCEERFGGVSASARAQFLRSDLTIDYALDKLFLVGPRVASLGVLGVAARSPNGANHRATATRGFVRS